MKKHSVYIYIALLSLTSCINKQQSDNLNGKLTEKSGAFDNGQTTKSENEPSTTVLSCQYSLSIKLTPFIPDYPDLGSEGKQLLATRLNTAVSKIGYGGDGANPRFIIGPSINILSKNVTSTAPTKYANTYASEFDGPKSRNEFQEEHIFVGQSTGHEFMIKYGKLWAHALRLA